MHAPIPGALSAALSTAGSGLLLWTGLSLAMAPAGSSRDLQGLQAWSLATGLGLLAASLALALLVRPQRPGPRRRGVTAREARALLAGGLAALLAGGLLATMPGMAGSATHAHGWRFAGGLLAPVALVAVVAGALAGSGQAGSRAGVAVTQRLLAALLAGLALLFALMASQWPVGGDGGRMLGLLLVLGSLLAASQALGWREAARSGLARPDRQRRWAAVGLAVAPALLALALEAVRPGVAGAAALWLVALAALLGLLLAPGAATPEAAPAPGTAPEHSA